MTFLARLGISIANPRWALAIAGDRRHAGRSGSDLIVMIFVLLVATRLRPLVERIWIGIEVGAGQGLRGVIHVLTQTLVLDLAILIIGAVLLWLLGGKRRNAGRAFDLVCVAVLPLLVVDITATFAVRALDLRVPFALAWSFSVIAWAWTGALLALAIRTSKSTATKLPDPPSPVILIGKRTGGALLAIALLATVIQVVWIVRNVEHVRPVDRDAVAPPIALPTIVDDKGTLGPVRELSRGKIVIVDFWATWCGPCQKALPRLDRIARRGDVEVLAINLDDRARAFQLFAQRGYAMTLLADDEQVSERYGVSVIPHTVVIDRDGVVRLVSRGTGLDEVESLVEQIRK